MFLQSLCSVLLVSFICVFALCSVKLYILFLLVASHTSCLLMSNPPWVCIFPSVSLPCPSLSPHLHPFQPPLGSIPGYFPIRMSSLCWEHVCLLPLTLSSSHTGCLMAPSTTFCMKAPVSTFTLVTKSVFFFNHICCFEGICE